MSSFSPIGIVLALSLCLVGACAPTIETLDIRAIKNLSLVSIGPSVTKMLAEVEIGNDRPISVSMDRIEAQFAFAGDFIGTGALDERIDLPSGGSTTVELPLVIDSQKVTRTDFLALFEQAIPYRLVGSAHLLEPLELGQLNFAVEQSLSADSRIEVELSEQAAFSLATLPNMGVDPISAFKAVNGIEVEVHNPFAISIPVLRLDYKVHKGDDILAEGEQVEAFELPPGSSLVKLPVDARILNGMKKFFGGLFRKSADPLLAELWITVKGEHREFVFAAEVDLNRETE